MLQIKKILFPTDQSECAKQALGQATFLADWHEAELHTLSVLEDVLPPYLQDELRLTDEEIVEQLHLLWEGDGPAGTDEEAAKPTLVTEQVKAPSAAEGILRYAEEKDVDLIVMGTHGRRGTDRVLMGSVAEEVVRRAECPVFTVRPQGESASVRPVERVMAPIDFSDFTEVAIDYAVELAQTYGARIDLVHVVKDASLPGVYGMDALPAALENVETRAYEELENLAREHIGFEDVRVAVEVGHPAGRITDYAEEEDIDLIVIPSHGRSGLKRMLMGSVAEKVVRRAPCPVFTLKNFGKSLLPAKPRGG